MKNKRAKSFNTCKWVVALLGSLLLSLALSAQLAAQARYSVTDIGSVNDLNDHVAGAAGISNRGLVVGQAILPRGPHRAFLWMRGTVLDLGTLGGEESGAAAINAGGQVVGVSDTANGSEHGFLWDHGSMVDLLTLGGDHSEANHINARGEIVGFAATTSPDPTFTTGPQQSHAFLCATGAICAAGGMKDLMTLGGPNSIAIDISSSGQIVGWSQVDFKMSAIGIPELHAATWINGVITPLDGLGGPVSLAIAVNDQGVAVGQSLSADFSSHAVMWQTGSLSDLGTLAGDVGSLASSINNEGEVVGVSFSDTFARAFVWKDGVMTDLNTLIPSSSGWVLVSANNVNDMGQIVGNGFLNGSLHAFLLTPSTGRGRTGSASTSPASSLSNIMRQWLMWGKSGLLTRNKR